MDNTNELIVNHQVGYARGRREQKIEDKEIYGKILAKIASKFGAREVLLALGDFKDIDIEELKSQLKLKDKGEEDD